MCSLLGVFLPRLLFHAARCGAFCTYCLGEGMTQQKLRAKSVSSWLWSFKSLGLRGMGGTEGINNRCGRRVGKREASGQGEGREMEGYSEGQWTWGHVGMGKVGVLSFQVLPGPLSCQPAMHQGAQSGPPDPASSFCGHHTPSTHRNYKLEVGGALDTCRGDSDGTDTALFPGPHPNWTCQDVLAGVPLGKPHGS